MSSTIESLYITVQGEYIDRVPVKETLLSFTRQHIPILDWCIVDGHLEGYIKRPKTMFPLK